jgi:small multidrug resistance pump
MNYVYLFAAIMSEVVATSALKAAEGFSRFWPSVIVIVGYGLAFYCLSLTVRTIPIGIAYAIWSGVGIVLTLSWACCSTASRWICPPSSAWRSFWRAC